MLGSAELKSRGWLSTPERLLMATSALTSRSLNQTSSSAQNRRVRTDQNTAPSCLPAHYFPTSQQLSRSHRKHRQLFKGPFLPLSLHIRRCIHREDLEARRPPRSHTLFFLFLF